MRVILVAVAACMVASVTYAELTAQNMAEIQAGMQNMELFKGLPLGGDPGDLSRHWEALLKISQMSAWNFVGREAACRSLSEASLNDLRVMNQTLSNSKLQTQFNDVDARRAFAIRYYHLLYFLYQYYRVMDWGWDVLNADFSTTGWENAADYSWQANAAKMREWLGAEQLSASAVRQAASAQSVSQQGGVRSVREIEAAIRRQQNYLRELERKLNRASDDYSSYQDSERRRYANGGRVSNGSLINGKLRTVQNFERLIRENERLLEQLENELEAARAREEKDAAAKEKSRGAQKSAEPAVPTSALVSDPPTATSVKRFCTECGEKAVPGAKFCGSCGHKL